MNDISESLEAAKDHVASERRALRNERDAFREFRDAIPRARTAETDQSAAGIETVWLLDQYRETVVATPEYASMHGDSVEESIQAEFPAGVAEALLSKRTVPARLERKFLTASNEVLVQRERFDELLGDELDSLQSVQSGLADVLSDLRRLPVCSLEETSFEAFSRAWTISEELLERCDGLLSNRQEDMVVLRDALDGIDGPHALNDYLYGGLETTHPALQATARTRECVERYQDGASGDEALLGWDGASETDASATCRRPP